MDNNYLSQFIKVTKELSMIGAVVFKDGKEIDRYHWEPEYRTNQYSISKSFVSTAVGMAISEGLIELHEPIKPFLKAHWPSSSQVSEKTYEYLESITLYHLLTITLGQSRATLMSSQRLALKTDDWINYVLTRPMVDEPGTRFVYNNGAYYLGAVVIEKVTGMSLIDYLMPRLFEPLGIYRPTWETDNHGRTLGASGLSLSVTEIAKFGELYLKNGLWQGRQLIEKQWVDQSKKRHINSNPDLVGSTDYGLGFWVGSHDSFRADGKYGQLSVVLPKKNAVVAINAFNRTTTDLMSVIWQELYPLL